MKWLIRVTAWERASLVRRMLLAFVRVALLIVLVTILIEVLGPPIGIFVTARSVARKVPGVRVAPQPLADYSLSSGPTTRLSYFGYEFEVPWNASFKVKGGKGGLVQLQFDSGRNLTFIVPANQGGLLSEIVQDRSMNMANLQLVFGELTNSSAYDQQAALLNITPQSVRSFGPRAQAVRGITLLTIKAIALGPGLATGVFSFQFADKRGFQIGDPHKSKRVDLEVFDMGGHHIEMLLFAPNDTARLSQPEINRVLMSLHSVAADSSAAAAAHLASPPMINDRDQ
jgi:hypothetical protein